MDSKGDGGGILSLVMAPEVSAVIPSTGRPEVIRAVRSALDQGEQVREVIVVLDGVDEAPAALVGIDDPRLVVVHHAVRRGAPAARNSGVKRATSEWIALLDDD